MAIHSVSFGARHCKSTRYRGGGFFAGESPATLDPDAADGRSKKLNVPARVRICIYERKSMLCIASTVSDADGTWRIEFLDPSLMYCVVGFDEVGALNAAIQDWVQPALME